MNDDVRQEHDSLGAVPVPADRYWGAQTGRALTNFAHGGDRFPPALIHALARVKSAAATANAELGELPTRTTDLVIAAARETAAGEHDDHIVVPVWQSGSGTQLNMNVNEVIAGRANELAGRGRGGREPVHPIDHVNRSQSSNDVIPTALHVATMLVVRARLLPALAMLEEALADRVDVLGEVVKTGRTHLMDALPVTLGQTFGMWLELVQMGRLQITTAARGLRTVPLGGTAVGTGLGAPAGFADLAVASLAADTALDLRVAVRPATHQMLHPAPLAVSSAMRDLATSLHRIADDLRLLASGPRCGLGELLLPGNEPGSSAMPGKVNPTQCESLAMICMQVAANDMACAQAAAAGHLELNTCRPLLARNLLHSARLLADGVEMFASRCIAGLDADRARIASQLGRSLMLVTALVPELGYDRAAAIARRAHAEGTSLRDAVIADGALTGEQFDALVRPERLARGETGGLDRS